MDNNGKNSVGLFFRCSLLATIMVRIIIVVSFRVIVILPMLITTITHTYIHLLWQWICVVNELLILPWCITYQRYKTTWKIVGISEDSPYNFAFLSITTPFPTSAAISFLLVIRQFFKSLVPCGYLSRKQGWWNLFGGLTSVYQEKYYGYKCWAT